MIIRRIPAILALTATFTANAEIYRCEVGGQAVFSDAPCGQDSRKVEVNPVTIGGDLKGESGIPQRSSYKNSTRGEQKSEKACPFISSTDLNRHIIRNEIVKGMKPADVRKSWGSPSSISTGGLTQWAYHGESASRYVYFEDGCVTSWNGSYYFD